MFDIGFSELVVIGVVALIVFGPEELPRVARTAGRLLSRFRNYVADVKAEINQEMEMSELKQLQAEVQDSARGLRDSLNAQINQTVAEVRDPIAEATQSVQQSVSETMAVSPAPVAEPASSGQRVPASELTPVETPAAGDEIAERDENQLDMFGFPVSPEPPHKS